MRDSVLAYLKARRGQMSRPQTEALLGPPTLSFLGPDERLDARRQYGISYEGTDLLGYHLMNSPPFPQSYREILWIKFDKKGMLDGAAIDQRL
jgi:hypothetical protein